MERSPNYGRNSNILIPDPCTENGTPETNTWLNLQKIECAVIWSYFRLLMLKVVPDISRHYFDALNEREIGR